jgi:hypothetical protein
MPAERLGYVLQLASPDEKSLNVLSAGRALLTASAY